MITKTLQSQKESSPSLGLHPNILKELNKNMEIILKKFKSLGYHPVIITSATIRLYFYRLINSSFPEVAVLSYSELPSHVEIEFIDKLEIENAN
jgi:flagellar biosynthesis protein FlhA